MATLPLRSTVAVGAHLVVDVAAALDDTGGLLGVESLAPIIEGYRRPPNRCEVVGASQLRRHRGHRLLSARGCTPAGCSASACCVARGSTDPSVNAVAGEARASPDAMTVGAQSGDACAETKTRDETSTSDAFFGVALFSARKSSTQIRYDLRRLFSTGPESIRAELRHLKAAPMRGLRVGLSTRHQARPGRDRTKFTPAPARPTSDQRRPSWPTVTRCSARGRRDALSRSRSTASAPTPRRRCWSRRSTTPIGSAAKPPSPSSAACRRLTRSSGKNERHRLNRGGDRQANSALWRLVVTRMVCDTRTRDYVDRTDQRRPQQERGDPVLKRHIARYVYSHLPR